MGDAVRVVVTGGAGFIGSHVVRELARRGARVVVLDDLSTGAQGNLEGAGHEELVVGSVLDTDLVDEACADADAVVHLAALASVPASVADPVAAHRVNASGTVAVLEATRRSGAHVVVASSSAVYGRAERLPLPETVPPSPISPYGASKLAMEGYALAYAASFGLPVLAFRPFNVFGPNQPVGHAYAAAIPAFVSAALEGKPLQVFGDGQQSRGFDYVASVASVLADAVERRVTHETPVNLAFEDRRSLLDLIAELEAILDVDLTVEFHEGRPGDIRHSQADTQLLRSLFPDAQPTPFREGLARTIDWFRAQQ